MCSCALDGPGRSDLAKRSWTEFFLIQRERTGKPGGDQKADQTGTSVPASSKVTATCLNQLLHCGKVQALGAAATGKPL